MLNLQDVKKDYVTSSETVQALRGVSISFRSREFVSILGPSGCGKTTLLNIIGGLDHYTSGEMSISGRSTRSYTDRDWDVYRNHRVGFIFQSYNLIPHQTVLGNVELALTIAGISKDERIERAKRALDRVGLSDQYYKRPNQLSGGQCQRVAIARALVNDPEILLADEPTGALDTTTSVQIMDLIKEISGERLVIMVTHNPELAEQYSSRIVRLRDGLVLEDTNPYSADDERRECELEAESKKKLEAEELNDKKAKKPKKEKAKMSVFTAFMLSARNLLSKKGRTAMVGIAGSIGIIGIAMVLAFSAGIKGYVASMQDDMLSGNPIKITENAYDLTALTGMMNTTDKIDPNSKIPGNVYVSSLINYVAKMLDTADKVAVENTITAEYIDYLKAMPSEYYQAMMFGYGINMDHSIYVDLKIDENDPGHKISATAIMAMYSDMLKTTDFKDYAQYITQLAPTVSQLPNNNNYILTQYDLVGTGSRMPNAANEVVIVLNSDDELSDLLLAKFGFYNQDQFMEIVNKATNENGSYNKDIYKDYFSYEELLEQTLLWYPNNEIFDQTTNQFTGKTAYTYNAYADNFEAEGYELKVVGILTPKESVNFGSLSSGIYYTEAFVNHVLTENKDSAIFEHINAIDESNTSQMALMNYYISYSFEYSYTHSEITKHTCTSTIGPSVSTADMISQMMGSSSTGIDHKDMKENMIRSLGGNDLANSVKIYPVTFDDKDLVTNYLDKWNADGDLVYGDVTVKDREEVTYTDTLELVINVINTMIDIISYALIAFTSISLVVSTVMIGIITYVSVVERIKEIGVIRSLGGRKRDVSNLFIAETFILGLLSGLIGVGFTYLASVVVNLILEPLIGYERIAALPVSNAIFLIILSITLTLISGLMPASSAAKKDPVVALRTE